MVVAAAAAGGFLLTICEDTLVFPSSWENDLHSSLSPHCGGPARSEGRHSTFRGRVRGTQRNAGLQRAFSVRPPLEPCVFFSSLADEGCTIISEVSSALKCFFI
ncbi:hypothetical protein CgunFtcFv8_021367 [Champsocephalus gunnari]|uniref:Uncharacterized protein n=1 Tax=Champsocephalus gunnari TaxID=52237 RepID=A0AAN8I2A8_CHAGU|nr:hypothetical protein CgunFtcFv8_021367 [Champsocephalus gunnari]